jgi:CheY-like chemotaxis protein
LPLEHAVVSGDPDRLAQVFSNLLSNSAKYTDPGGRITLTLEASEREAVVTVEDTGAGIPPSALEHVFEMFARVPTHKSRAKEGLGIGLSLVKSLVEMHDGSVRAFSEGLGKGSRFTVRLPTVARAAVISDVPSGSAARPRVARVLVVDDNADAATSLALLLRMQGHEVRTAADGEEAFECVRTFAPQIIFMDLGMPRLDGCEAARRIRALPQGATMRIVALTGWGQAADRERTRAAGMDQHLIKPVSLESLREVLAGLGHSRAAPAG